MHSRMQGEKLTMEDDDLLVTAPGFYGTLRFISFPTSRIDTLFDIIRHERETSPHEVSNWKVFSLNPEP